MKVFEHDVRLRTLPIIACLLALILATSIVACGSSGDDDSNAGGSTEQAGPTATATTQELSTPSPASPTSAASPTEEGQSTMTPEDDLPPPVQNAVQTAAEDAGVPVEQVELLGFEHVEWSDSSLGCPQPGQFYAQVIVSGYLVRVEVEGVTVEYHTDTGRQIVRC